MALKYTVDTVDGPQTMRRWFLGSRAQCQTNPDETSRWLAGVDAAVAARDDQRGDHQPRDGEQSTRSCKLPELEEIRAIHVSVANLAAAEVKEVFGT